MKKNALFLLGIGVLSALFFSTTFLVNRAITLEGGHWYWSAALRYLFMLILLRMIFLPTKGRDYFRSIIWEFFRHIFFWTTAGTIGFGCFYALICFAAATAPGWIVATTWQFTIIASLFVLALFGRKLSRLTWLCTFIIVAGISLVNVSHVDWGAADELLINALPVLVAAFCYPLGNQLVWEAKNGRRFLPTIPSHLADDTFAKVFLLSLGSIPFWIGLYGVLERWGDGVGTPSFGQIVNVGLIAVFSGVIATTLFLYARSRASTAGQLALVDATQSGEVLFALLGEVALLGALLPNRIGMIGLVVTLIGLLLLVKQEQ